MSEITVGWNTTYMAGWRTDWPDNNWTRHCDISSKASLTACWDQSRLKLQDVLYQGKRIC